MTKEQADKILRVIKSKAEPHDYWQNNDAPIYFACDIDPIIHTLIETNLKLSGSLEYFRDAQCDCSIAERESGHLTGCWFPEAQEKLDALTQETETIKRLVSDAAGE